MKTPNTTNELLLAIDELARSGSEEGLDELQQVVEDWLIDDEERRALIAIIELAREFIYALEYRS